MLFPASTGRSDIMTSQFVRTPNLSGGSSVATRRVLEPSDRISEVLFGLIMVLTFTGSLSIADAERDDIRAMLIGALGCNLAWGIIDAVLYLLGALAEKARNLRVYKAVLAANDAERSHQLIADALPTVVASVLGPVDFEGIRQRLQDLPKPPERARLSRPDWWGSLGIFLLVFLSTLPVAVPFMVMHVAPTALRLSNAIAVGMLFICGVAYGRVVGTSPWLVGVSMVGLGVALVGLTMALGG
jgi:VIT1/CCC1 family predicted Fe2+/Mn2+ transporter